MYYWLNCTRRRSPWRKSSHNERHATLAQGLAHMLAAQQLQDPTTGGAWWDSVRLTPVFPEEH